MELPSIDPALERWIVDYLDRNLTGRVRSQDVLNAAWTLLWSAARLWREASAAAGQDLAEAEKEFSEQASHALLKGAALQLGRPRS